MSGQALATCPDGRERADARLLLVGHIAAANAAICASGAHPLAIVLDEAALVRAADRLIDACCSQPQEER